jgi:hypothetical protein
VLRHPTSPRSDTVSPPHRFRHPIVADRARHAARLPGVCGPFDVYLQAQRRALGLDSRRALAPTGSTSPAPLRPRSFALPRRFLPHPAARPCFVPVPSLGFHTFEGFSPPVAPKASRPSMSSMPFPACAPRLRGFLHRADALSSLRVVSADDARSFLGRSPLRGLDLHGLTPRFRRAPLLGFSGSVRPPSRPSLGPPPSVRLSSCSSEFHRSEKVAGLSPSAAATRVAFTAASLPGVLAVSPVSR